MDRVGVLVTQWGEPEGFDPLYRRTVVNRTRGEVMAHPGEPFTDSYVGDFPFRNSMGLLPHAVAHPVPGMETAYDSYGFFRLSEDGAEYVNVTDAAHMVAGDRNDLFTQAVADFLGRLASD